MSKNAEEAAGEVRQFAVIRWPTTATRHGVNTQMNESYLFVIKLYSTVYLQKTVFLSMT